jgi:competence protein ComEC
MIAYIGGIFTVALLPSLQAVWPVFLILPLAAVKRLRGAILLYLLGVILAACWGGRQLSHRLPVTPDPQDVVIQGHISGLVQQYARHQVFDLSVTGVDSLLTEHLRLRRVRLSVYHSEEVFRAGDELRARVRLRSPRGQQNPAANDSERFYLAAGIDARGYVRELLLHQRGTRQGIDPLRQLAVDWLDTHFSAQAALTLRALIVGDRTGLDDQHWEWLRRTGTAHLLVVSGLHIAVVATLGWLTGRIISAPLMLAGGGALSRFLPALFALAAATVYAALAGWGLPVQRAWLMLLVFLIGNWQLLDLGGWQRLKLALVVILTLQPLAILEPGLWLSFTAVALILWQLQQRQPPLHPWLKLPTQWWRLQLYLFAGMSLVLVMNFNQLSPLGIVVNLIAVPWVSLTIWLLPLLLLLVMFVPAAGQLIEWNLSHIWSMLHWASEAPGLVVQTAQPSLSVLVLALAGVAVMLLPLPLRMRGAGLMLFLPLLLAPSAKPEADHFRVWMFDVGQGQAVLIETAEQRVIYDTGPGFGDGRSAFSYTVAPYLRSLGSPMLDRVVVSHADLDHSGGFAELHGAFETGRIYGGEPLEGVSVESCRQGGWQSAGVSFEFLTPFKDQDGLSSNDRSCVLRVSNGYCSLLLTGDLSQSGEYRLLSAGKIEPVTWLVAGHHGSRDSLAAALLDFAVPEHVLISAGYGNRFGHPHADVIERIEARGIPWSSTARDGALLLQASDNSCTLSRYRESKKRYWTAG